MDKENIYELVPGKGQPLQDGTWWTGCNVRVGEVCETHHYYRKYEGGRHWSKPNRSECVETGSFGGLKFARWKQLDSEWKPAIRYNNNSMAYA